MPFVDANGLSIYYELHGDPDSPRLLNISGTGGDLRKSFPGQSPLNQHFHVLHYDQRGLGQTSKPSGRQEMTDYAADAAALIAAIGWDRCHVVGTSFGGMVAQYVATESPELVDRLVLNCTSPGGTLPSFPLHTIADLDVEARIELVLGLFDNRWDPGQDDPIPGLGPFYDLMVANMRIEPSEEAAAGSASQLDARSRHDRQGHLHKITAPTLVACGEFDDQAPVHNATALVDEIPDARLQIFNGGHLFMLQDPDSFPAIIRFLQN